jgi:hypothetical protein
MQSLKPSKAYNVTTEAMRTVPGFLKCPTLLLSDSRTLVQNYRGSALTSRVVRETATVE